MARLTLQELLRRNIAGAQILDPLTRQLGIPAWQIDGGGLDENGNPLNTGVADPSRLAALQGYTFDWQDTGPANTGTLTAYDPSGNVVGSFNQQDQSAGSAFGEWAALAAAGFGGAGLLGLGPLGGALGGLTGATNAGGIAAGDTAANLAAYGASLTPAEVAAGVGGLDLGAAGVAGAAGTAGAAGASGAAGAVASAVGDAGFWGSALKTVAPVLGTAVGGLIQSNAAGNAADAQSNAAREAAAAIQKALQPYQTAGAEALAGQRDILGMNGGQAQQAAIDAIKASPAFTSMQQLGENRILQNASATGGLRGGNAQAALAQFSPQLLAQLIDQQYSRLGGLAGNGLRAAGGVAEGQAGAATQIGSAQSGQALATGTALKDFAASGFGALGQYLGKQAGPAVTPTITTMTPFGQFQLSGGF